MTPQRKILMILKSINTMRALKQIFKPGRIIATIMLGVLSLPAWAQSNGTSVWSQEIVFYTMVGIVFAVAILVLLVAIYVLQLLKVFVAKNSIVEEVVMREAEPSTFSKLWDKWNALKPMEQEADIILDHDYDGIKELDNHLPPWWKGLFYLTIVYAVVYIMVFHVFKSAPLQEEKYEIAMAQAEENATSRQSTQTLTFDETNVTFTDVPADLEAGKKIFEMQCAPCHKPDGGGSVGPNLTDNYWLHGGSMKDIYYTIKVGVPAKGMIAWEQLLSPERMRNVSSYILTLVGTNPPGAKAAQGDLYEPEGSGQ
jgi:cytochrome c oxidase cbb3-type subunit III